MSSTSPVIPSSSHSDVEYCCAPLRDAAPAGHGRQPQLLPVRVVRVARRRELIEERRAQGTDVLGGLIAASIRT